MLTQGMRAKHASSTIARANYHTHLPSFKRPASRLVGHRFRDADDETSRQRGAWDVPANYVKVAFNVSSSSDHTETTAMRGVGCPREGVGCLRRATMK